MAGNTFATHNDLMALAGYSTQQRAQVLACYLLDNRHFTMQEVAELVFGDSNPQAGQRVSLITRSYGFSARNAGRYSQDATKEDILDFVRRYQPERTAGGLPEGTFDAFLQSRQQKRMARQQAEQQRRLEEQRRQQARRQAEQRHLLEQQQTERRLEEQQMLQVCQQAQQAQQKPQTLNEKVQLALKEAEVQQKAEMKRLRQQAMSLAQEAEKLWQGEPGPRMLEGIQLYRKARAISWWENGSSWSITPSVSYYSACARMASYFLSEGNTAQALACCGYLCDERPAQVTQDRDPLSKQRETAIIGQGCAIRTQIYLDQNSGYYNLQEALRSAKLGAACQDPFCMTVFANHLEQGCGVPKNLRGALSLYQKLTEFPDFREAAQSRRDQVLQQVLEELAAEIAAGLEAGAPDAFSVAGREHLDWKACRKSAVDLPALWNIYQQAHNTVETKGGLFKRRISHYTGEVTWEQFEAGCRHIWETRRERYAALSPDYRPCPSERARADEDLRRGLEQMERQNYLEAASLLKLPALCGSRQARHALVDLYTNQLQDPKALADAVSLLAQGADEASMPLLAGASAHINDWDHALAYAERAGEPHWTELCRRAVKWMDGALARGAEIPWDRALEVYQTGLGLDSRGRAALLLSQKCPSPERQRNYLEMAVEEGEGNAFFPLALLEIQQGADWGRVRALLEEAERRNALPDREYLAAAYTQGAREDEDWLRAAKIYVELPQIRDRELCLKSCMHAYKRLIKKPGQENQELLFQVVQKIDALGSGKKKLAAQFMMGYFYSLGQGVEKDVQRGMPMIEASARQGYDLAICYLASRCLKQGNLSKAEEWLNCRTEDSAQYTDLLKELHARLEELEGLEQKKMEDWNDFVQDLENAPMIQWDTERQGWDFSDGPLADSEPESVGEPGAGKEPEASGEPGNTGEPENDGKQAIEEYLRQYHERQQAEDNLLFEEWDFPSEPNTDEQPSGEE